VDGAEVGVLEEANEVSLSGLLESENRRALEAEVSLELLGNLANQALERELADEELSGLLVSPDLAESDSAWAVPVGLLHASSGWGVLAGCLGGELLTRGPVEVRERVDEEESVLARIEESNRQNQRLFSTANSFSKMIENQTALKERLTCHLWTCGQFALFGPFKSFRRKFEAQKRFLGWMFTNRSFV
jgi:hypothetical protein